MAFTGDASHIPISNIVQALFMNGQEGVLTIFDGEQCRNVRVLKVGIRLLSSSRTDPDILKYALVKERILTETEVQNSLSTWNPKSLYPGEFLRRRRVITTENVEEQIRKQFEELVLEIFSSQDLRYEFKAGEEWNDHEVFDPEGLGKTLIFNVNGVLMETVRREDDWIRIREALPTELEIFVPTSKSLPPSRPREIDLADRSFQEVRRMLSGDKTVARIIEESCLSRYEVNHALFLLATQGYVRPLDLGEKEKLAEKLRRMMKTKEAIGLYESMLATAPDNVRLRVQIVSLLEKAKYGSAFLMEHYETLVTHFEHTDPAKAIVFTQKILKLDPAYLPAYEHQFGLYRELQNKEGALATARMLVRTFKGSDDQEEATETLMRLADDAPDEPYLLQEIADLLLGAGRDGEAIAYLKSLASLYESRGDAGRLRRTCELIVKIDPSETRMRRMLADGQRPASDPSSLFRSAAVAAIGSAIVALLAFIAWTEIAARQLYAEAQGAVNTLLEHGDYEGARAAVRDVERAYPWTSVRRSLSSLLEDIERAETKRQEDKEWQIEKVTLGAQSALGKADYLIKQGDYAEAYKLLTDAYREVSRFSIPPEHQGKVSRLKKQLQMLHQYFASADAKLEEVRKAEREGDLARAHAAAREMLTGYPYSPAAKSLEVPILITSVPEGAALQVDGVSVDAVTPVIVRFSPFRQYTLEFARRGFHPESVRISEPLNTHTVSVSLEKAAAWIFQHRGPSEAFPVALGSNVYFSNRNGEIFSVNQDGEQRWKYTVPNRYDLTGGLGLWNNFVYTGCYDGNVYVLSAGSGTLVGRPIPGSPQSLPIKHAPSAVSSRGAFAVNCGGSYISGIDLARQTRLWSRPSSSQLLGPPVIDGDEIFIFTREGTLLRFDPHTGDPIGRPIPLGDRMNTHGTVIDKTAFFSLENGTVQAVDARSERTLWSRQFDWVTASPTVAVDAQLVVVPLASQHLLCLDARSGDEKWRVPVGGAIECEGVAFRNKLFVGTRDGRIMRLDLATGALGWSFRSFGASEEPPRGILGRGVISQGRYYQGSSDGFFYCLELD